MSGLIGGAGARSGLIGNEYPRLVWSGWNAAHNTQQSAGTINYTLDYTLLDQTAGYMTKSNNVFTCIRRGTYMAHLTCMSQAADSEYIHHQIHKNGAAVFYTHDYGTGNNWHNYNYSIPIPMTETQYVTFSVYVVANVNYAWYAGTGYNSLNLWYMSPFGT